MRFIVWICSLFISIPAWPALEAGQKAPDFTTQASLGGSPFTYHLADALKKGPVVVYFYPAAFTKGCSIEAHEFAQAMPQFQALGASVIGVSNDSIEVLNKFAVSECQSKFPVASDLDQRITKAYDAVLLWKTNYANRISYVVMPDGKITYAYSDLSPDKHVENALSALRTAIGSKK